jgi:hypothetical protein
MSAQLDSSQLDLFHELSFYTLTHSDPAFLHQNAVDAFTAQQLSPSSKPIAGVFALLGLYLHVEKQFTGKKVQLAHMQLAKHRKAWTMPRLPVERGSIRVSDVLVEGPGPARDAMIHRWCVSVWDAFYEARPEILLLVETELDIR